MNLIKIIISIIAFVSFFSCGKSVESVDVNIENFSTERETASDVTSYYSEDGQVKAKISAPKLIRYKSRKEPATEFPEGMDVTFYGGNKKVTSTLTAKYGIRKEKEQIVTLRDSIVFVNVKGERLETDKLIWNGKTEKVVSDTVFTLTTKDDFIKGDGGFEANQDFSRYKLKKNISGHTKVKSSNVK